MASIRDIKRRIKSIKTTQQITKAMQMVAAAKMRHAQDAAVRTRSYLARAVQLLGEIAHRRDEFRHKLLGGWAKEGKPLLIVVTANRGLAGGLSSNVIRLVSDLLTSELRGADADIVTVGRKGFEALTRMKANVIADFSPLPDKITFSDISPMTTFAIKGFMKGEYNRVSIVSPHYVSTLVQKPVVKQVMPLGKELVRFFREMHADAIQHPESEDSHDEYLFEPSPSEVLSGLLPQLVEMQIYQSVLEAQASEHSARMVAMKNATESAGDIMEELQFTANQLRQSSITQEIAEITAGANALNN